MEIIKNPIKINISNIQEYMLCHEIDDYLRSVVKPLQQYDIKLHIGHVSHQWKYNFSSGIIKFEIVRYKYNHEIKMKNYEVELKKREDTKYGYQYYVDTSISLEGFVLPQETMLFDLIEKVENMNITMNKLQQENNELHTIIEEMKKI